MHAHHKYGFIGLLFMASIQQTPQGPVIVLKESALQQKGKEAQQNNITAAKLVSELVRSSLGPRGLDKMLVDSLGDVTITNDGATILKEIDVQHPAAKMMVEISKTVDNEVGDGTTSSVVFGGALLEKAEDLLKRNVHSSVIVEGYQLHLKNIGIATRHGKNGKGYWRANTLYFLFILDCCTSQYGGVLVINAQIMERARYEIYLKPLILNERKLNTMVPIHYCQSFPRISLGKIPISNCCRVL